MGWAFGGRCYGTQAEAADAAWSGVGPVLSGSPPILSVVEKGASGWQVSSYDGAVLVSAEPVPSIAFAECSPGDLAVDGIALGWLVVGVWALAWAVNVLRRGLGWGWS